MAFEIGLILVLEDVVADAVRVRQLVAWYARERRQGLTPVLVLALYVLDAEIFPAIVPPTVTQA